VRRDARGAVTEVSWADGALGLGRDAAGRVARVTLGGRPMELERDAAGRVEAVVDGPDRWRLRRDPEGRVVAVEGPGTAWRLERGPRGGVDRFEAGGLSLGIGRGASGQVLRITGPSGAVLGVDRDVAGRPITVRFPDGELLRIQPVGHGADLAWEDAEGRATGTVRLRADALGRLASVTDGSGERRYRYGPRDEVVAVEEGEGAWSLLPGLLETPGGTQIRLGSAGPAEEGFPPGPVAAWGLAGARLAWRTDARGGILADPGEAGVVRLAHDPLGRLVGVEALAEGEPTRTWRLAWDPLGGLGSVEGPDGRTDVVTALGGIRVLSGNGRRAAVLDGPYGVRVLAAPEGRVSLAGDGLLAPGGLPGAPRVHSTPGGLPDGIVPGPFGAFGRFQVFPGGPLVGPADALDPVTGQPTGAPPVRWPWSPTGWPRPDAAAPWPEPDGAATVAWDPEAWAPEGPWGSPLALLVALGEIPPDEPTFEAEEPPAPLPWLPAGLEGPAPPGWPLAVDPVTAVVLRAAMRPCTPIAEAALLRALLGDLALPRPVPGLGWPAGLPDP
jgi:YD repeat-containing protein